MGEVRLSVKIGGGFALVGIIILVIVIWTYLSYQKNAHNIGESIVMSRQTSMLKDIRFHIVQVHQWLSDISATRGLDGLNDGFDEAEKHKNKFYEYQTKLLSEYKERNETDLVSEVESLAARFDAFYETGKKMAQGYIDGGPEVGNKMMGNFDAVAADLQDTLIPLIEGEIEEYNIITANAEKAAENSSRNTAILGSLAILLSTFLAFFITRAVSGPLSRIAQGLNDGASQVSASSGQVAGSGQELAEGASEQAASLEETSASLEEISSMTKQNAENSSLADNLMREANTIVKKAGDSMAELTSSMQAIIKASEETSKIIKTIDEIAFQTNLLALNAAVEAARAGEAGAGFAVVADEVRNLAMRAAKAAKDTAELIDGTVKRVGEGSELVSRTNAAFAEVADSTAKATSLVGEIAVASSDQSQGISQLNQAMLEMDAVVQGTAANAEESAAAAEELSAMASQMKDFVGELIVLVEGSKGNRPTAGAERHFPAPLRRPAAAPAQSRRPAVKALAAPARKPSAQPAGKPKAAPKEVIPFDDDEYKDF